MLIKKTDDLIEKSETEITNDPNLVTVEAKSDEDVTNALSEFKVNSISITIQYKIFKIKDKINKILRYQLKLRS